MRGRRSPYVLNHDLRDTRIVAREVHKQRCAIIFECVDLWRRRPVGKESAEGTTETFLAELAAWLTR